MTAKKTPPAKKAAPPKRAAVNKQTAKRPAKRAGKVTTTSAEAAKVAAKAPMARVYLAYHPEDGSEPVPLVYVPGPPS